MNLPEAIQNCGDNWFRPMQLKGTGSAYESKYNIIYFHNNYGNIVNEICPFASWLCGEWEIVDPSIVIDERIK
jgi:hypothetical protein